MPEPDHPEAAGNRSAGPVEPRAEPLERPTGPFVPAAPSGLQRMIRALSARPDFGQVAVAVLVGALGFAAVVQVRIDDEDLLNRARRTDLIEIFGGLQQRSERLEDQIGELQAARSDLLSGEASEQAALEQAANRQRQLAVLAGTAPASGPGIEVTITGVQTPATSMLSAVQELRVAGAEAIQIEGGNGAAVRVGVDTYFLDRTDPRSVDIDGVRLTLPFVITAIGEPSALEGAMAFPGGLTENAIIEQRERVTVDVLRDPTSPEYAQPAADGE